MSDTGVIDCVSREQYVIEVDGRAYFAEAIAAALLLGESSPGSKINVRDKSSKHELAA